MSRRALRNLRSTRRVFNAGLGGTRNEHFKDAWEDEAALDKFVDLVQRLAEADVPSDLARLRPAVQECWVQLSPVLAKRLPLAA